MSHVFAAVARQCIFLSSSVKTIPVTVNRCFKVTIVHIWVVRFTVKMPPKEEFKTLEKQSNSNLETNVLHVSLCCCHLDLQRWGSAYCEQLGFPEKIIKSNARLLFTL